MGWLPRSAAFALWGGDICHLRVYQQNPLGLIKFYPPGDGKDEHSYKKSASTSGLRGVFSFILSCDLYKCFIIL